MTGHPWSGQPGTAAGALGRGDVHRAARLLHKEWTGGLIDPEQAASLLWRLWADIRRPREAMPVPAWVKLFRGVGYRVGDRSGGHPQSRPTEPVRLYRGATAAGRGGLHWSSDTVVPRGAARAHGGHVWVADVDPCRLLATYLGTGHPEVLVDADGMRMERLVR